MTDLLVTHGRVYALLWGAVWGSFLNVVIHRLPRGRSLVRPGSHCGACEAPVRWYDNVPVLAWFWLRGRCRDCRAPFSIRYAGVELLTALISLALYEVVVVAGVHAGEPEMWLLAVYMVRFAFAAALVVVTFIDLELQLVPTVVTVGGAAAGLMAAGLLDAPPWKESVTGALLGGGSLLIINGLYKAVRGHDGFGGATSRC